MPAQPQQSGPELVRHRKADGPIFVEPKRPHLKPGVREMLCEQAAIDEKFNRQVAKLTFLDPLSGDRVDFFPTLNPRPGTKFYTAWTIANGSPPKSGQIMSVRVFRGKFFEIEIGDTRKTYDGRKLKAGEGYSVVRRILRRTQ